MPLKKLNPHPSPPIGYPLSPAAWPTTMILEDSTHPQTCTMPIPRGLQCNHSSPPIGYPLSPASWPTTVILEESTHTFQKLFWARPAPKHFKQQSKGGSAWQVGADFWKKQDCSKTDVGFQAIRPRLEKTRISSGAFFSAPGPQTIGGNDMEKQNFIFWLCFGGAPRRIQKKIVFGPAGLEFSQPSPQAITFGGSTSQKSYDFETPFSIWLLPWTVLNNLCQYCRPRQYWKALVSTTNFFSIHQKAWHFLTGTRIFALEVLFLAGRTVAPENKLRPNLRPEFFTAPTKIKNIYGSRCGRKS